MEIFQLDVSFMRWSFDSSKVPQNYTILYIVMKGDLGDGMDYVVIEKLFLCKNKDVEDTSLITVWKSMRIHFTKTQYGSILNWKQNKTKKKHLQPKQNCKLNFSNTDTFLLWIIWFAIESPKWIQNSRIENSFNIDR